MGLLKPSPEFHMTLLVSPTPKASKTLLLSNNIRHRKETSSISTMVDLVGGEEGSGVSEVGVEEVRISSGIKWPVEDTTLALSSSLTVQDKELDNSRAV